MLRALLLLSFLALVACDSTSPFDPNIDIVDVSSGDVREARARWEASGGADYTMMLRRSCFCGQDAIGPYEVRVEGGVIDLVLIDGERTDAELGRTIVDLFDLLDNALDEDAASVQAAFDTERGYPLRLSIDYNELIADEEIGYDIANVRLN